MGKDLHKVFSTIVKDIFQELTNFGESGSEVSHFIPEPRNFAEVTKLSENIRKYWMKATPIRLDFCFINIHAWSDWFTILWVLNHESLVIDEILHLLESCFQPTFSYIF